MSPPADALSPAQFQYDLHFNLGHAHLWAGEVEQAVRAFTHAAEAGPHHPDVHHNLGVLGLLQDQPARARAHFEAAVRIGTAGHSTGVLPAHEMLARLAAGQDADRNGNGNGNGDRNDLKAAAWRSLRLPAYLGSGRDRDLFLPAMIRTATRLRRAGAAEVATGIRDLMRAGVAEHPEAATNVAEAFFQIGWMAETEALCRDAGQTTPAWERRLFLLGQALAFQDRLEEALAVFRQSMAVLPELSTYSVMIVQLALHRPEAALLDYQRADPTFRAAALAQSLLGMIFHSLGRWSEAEDCHREAVARSQSSNGTILSQQGLTVLRRGKPAEALVLFRRGAALDRDYFTMGNLQAGLACCGRDQEAAAVGRDLAATWPWTLRFLARQHASFGMDPPSGDPGNGRTVER